MAVFDTSDGALPIGPDPTPPPNPVQELRSTIGRMADCLTRMLDQLGGELLDGAQIAYLRNQLDHLASGFMDAHHSVAAFELLQEAAAPDFLEGFNEQEIIHLGIGRLDRGQTGGGA